MNKCSGCALLPKFCACASWEWAHKRFTGTQEHKVSVIVHTLEVGRSNSTHRLLAKICNADVFVISGKTEILNVWKEIENLCALDGLEPWVLYPRETALLPKDALSSMRCQLSGSQLSGSASGSTSPTSPRRPRMRIIVLEGKWREASYMASSLPAHTRFIMLPMCVGTNEKDAESLFPQSLFQPCRSQPSPGALCTAEAVASTLDALAAAGDNETDDTDTLDTTILPLPTFFTLPTFAGDTLRFALKVFVDRHIRQANLLGIGAHTRGAGYRTWDLGAGVGTNLSKLPAWVLINIAEFTYGSDRGFEPNGYFQRCRFKERINTSDGTERKESAHDLPPANMHTSSALALTCKTLYFLAAGRWLLQPNRQ